MTQRLCDRFIVARRLGLATKSTDVTFESLMHSIGSVGLPAANQPCEIWGSFSPSARRAAEAGARVSLHVSRAREGVRKKKKAAGFDTGGPPVDTEEAPLLCRHVNEAV